MFRGERSSPSPPVTSASPMPSTPPARSTTRPGRRSARRGAPSRWIWAWAVRSRSSPSSPPPTRRRPSWSPGWKTRQLRRTASTRACTWGCWSARPPPKRCCWRNWPPERGSTSVGGRLQRGDIELDHRVHGLLRPKHPVWIRVGHQLRQPLRNDLPGQPVAVLEPPALHLAAAAGKAVPVVVDLGLVGAVDLDRDGLAEREVRAAVDRGELTAVQLEQHLQRG